MRELKLVRLEAAYVKNGRMRMFHLLADPKNGRMLLQLRSDDYGNMLGVFVMPARCAAAFTRRVERMESIFFVADVESLSGYTDLICPRCGGRRSVHATTTINPVPESPGGAIVERLAADHHPAVCRACNLVGTIADFRWRGIDRIIEQVVK